MLGRVSRKIHVEYGSIASSSKAPRSGAEVKKWGITDTPQAIAIGNAAVRRGPAQHEDTVAAILAVDPGKVLYKGKVMDVERRATEGFCAAASSTAWAISWLEPRDQLPERVDRGVAGRRAARHVARPDLACSIRCRAKRSVARPSATASGHRDRAAPSPPVFLSPKGLQHVSPRAFGLQAYRLQERQLASLREITPDGRRVARRRRWVLGTGGAAAVLSWRSSTCDALYKEGYRVQLAMRRLDLDDDCLRCRDHQHGCALSSSQRAPDRPSVSSPVRLGLMERPWATSSGGSLRPLESGAWNSVSH